MHRRQHAEDDLHAVEPRAISCTCSGVFVFTAGARVCSGNDGRSSGTFGGPVSIGAARGASSPSGPGAFASPRGSVARWAHATEEAERTPATRKGAKGCMRASYGFASQYATRAGAVDSGFGVWNPCAIVYAASCSIASCAARSCSVGRSAMSSACRHAFSRHE